jgi:hypothetical protein
MEPEALVMATLLQGHVLEGAHNMTTQPKRMVLIGGLPGIG